MFLFNIGESLQQQQQKQVKHQEEEEKQQQEEEKKDENIQEKKNPNLFLTVAVEDYNTDAATGGAEIMQKLTAPKRSASLLACILKQYGFEHRDIDQQKTNEDCLAQINNILKEYKTCELENIILYLSGI